MEMLPNELMTELFKYFDMQTIKIGRLVNKYWKSNMDTSFEQRALVSFGDIPQLTSFQQAFASSQHSSIIPFQKFDISSLVLSSSDATPTMTTFGSTFGQQVISCYLNTNVFIPWELLDGSEDGSGVEDRDTEDVDAVEAVADAYNRTFQTNLVAVLSKTEHLKHLTLTLPANYEFGLDHEVFVLAVLTSLKSFHMEFRHIENLDGSSDCICIFTQIVKHAPELSLVEITYVSPKRAEKVFKLLETTNVTSVRLHKFYIKSSDATYLTNLIKIPISTRITELHVHICDYFLETVETMVEVLKTLELLLQVCQHSLRKLKTSLTANYTELPLSLPDMPSLEALNINFMEIHTIEDHPFRFPNLNVLNFLYEVEVSYLAGCVFDKVTTAKIQLSSDEEVEMRPMIIPNVVDLTARGCYFQAVFNFRKLTTLRFKFVDPHFRALGEDLSTNQWDQISGNAPRSLCKRVCDFPVDTNSTLPVLPLATEDADSDYEDIETFQNLTRLRTLEFLDESTDCWKAMIYVSRTGKLQRLRNLTFEFRNRMPSAYLKVLNDHHDEVGRSSKRHWFA